VELNTCIDVPDNRWNMHHLLSDTSTSRVKKISNGQHSFCAWRFESFDESHWYMTKNSVGWQIAMKARIGFKLHVTAALGFHSLYD
jgi:hypothetical protein